jgi:hypothetical protein
MKHNVLRIGTTTLDHLTGYCRALRVINIVRSTLWSGHNNTAAARRTRGMIRTGLAIAMLCIAGFPLYGQSDPDRADSPELDEATARQAFEVAENWVTRASVPDDSLPIMVRDLSAVHVALRINGQMLGQATAAASQPDDTTEPVDLMELSRRAVRDAMQAARDRLRQGRTQPTGPEMTQTLDDLASLVQLDMQFAHTLRPLELGRLADIPALITINRDGLAMRRDGRVGFSFPGSAIAAGRSLQSQLYYLIGQLDLPPDYLAQLPRDPEAQLYRFDVIHLVRHRNDAAPLLLERGDAPADLSPPDSGELAVMAQQWATQLIGRQRPDGRFAGTYQPAMDRYDPAIAPPADNALACFALARYVRVPSRSTAESNRLTTVIDAAIDSLITDVLGLGPESSESDSRRLRLAETAMTLAAILEAPGSSARKQVRDRLAGALQAMQRDTGRFVSRTGTGAPQATAPMQSLGAYAMVRLFEATRDPRHYRLARQALDTVWADREPGQIVSGMPWLAMAEFDLARLDRPSPALLALQQSCSELWELQISSDDLNGSMPRDVVGGFLLDSELINEPTWQSARIEVVMAAALRTKGFVGTDEQLMWLLRTALGMRFLDQLSLNGPALYYVHNPQNAMGGVRLAIFDHQQPLSATAMSLLAAAELQHSLHDLLNNDGTENKTARIDK